MPKLTLLFFCAWCFCAPISASAALVTTPYINEFLDSNSLSNFTANQNTWSLGSGNYQNVILSNASNKTSSSMLQFSDLGGNPLVARDFSLSTTFTITDSVGDSNSIGFAFLGNSSNATNNLGQYYLADVFAGVDSLTTPISAKLRFAEIGPTNPSWMPTLTLNEALKLFTPYLLQVHGNYNDQGDLYLKLEITGDNKFYSFPLGTPILKNDVLQGNFFGYRNRASGGAASALSVEFDSLNITSIPEPSSIGIVAASLLGGYAIGRYWHRRQLKKSA